MTIEYWRKPGTYQHRMMRARTVPCPHRGCWAKVGQDCRRPAGNGTLHKKREQAVAHLSHDQAVAAIETMLRAEI